VASAERDVAFAEVREWVQRGGGHVHAKLDVQVTPLGCRGVVAAQNLSVSDQERPVMMIPTSLCISSCAEGSALNSHLRARGLSASWWEDAVARVSVHLTGGLLDSTFRRGGGNGGAARVPGTAIVADQLLVALLLAHERSLGHRSAFSPFVASLSSDQPTCGWSLDSAQVRAALPREMPAANATHIVQSMLVARREYEDVRTSL